MGTTGPGQGRRSEWLGGPLAPPSRLENEAQRSEGTAGLGCQLPGAPGCDCPVWACCGPGPTPGPSWEAPVGGRRPLGDEAVHAPAGTQRLGHREPGDSGALGLAPRGLGIENQGLRSPGLDPWPQPHVTPRGHLPSPSSGPGPERSSETGKVWAPSSTPGPWTGSCQGPGEVTTQGMLPPPLVPSPAGLAHPSQPRAAGSARR